MLSTTLDPAESCLPAPQPNQPLELLVDLNFRSPDKSRLPLCSRYQSWHSPTHSQLSHSLTSGQPTCQVRSGHTGNFSANEKKDGTLSHSPSLSLLSAPQQVNRHEPPNLVEANLQRQGPVWPHLSILPFPLCSLSALSDSLACPLLLLLPRTQTRVFKSLVSSIGSRGPFEST